jgi:hypothetical protein
VWGGSEGVNAIRSGGRREERERGCQRMRRDDRESREEEGEIGRWRARASAPAGGKRGIEVIRIIGGRGCQLILRGDRGGQ